MQSALSAAHFHNEVAAFAYVEERLWPDGPICHHCGETARVSKLQGKSTRPGLYKCYVCRKPFTVRMGTVFESSHVPLHIWLQAIYLLCSSKKGISTRQLQRTFGGSMKTAWFLGHRIREAMKEIHGLFTPPLGGAGETVEADETYIGRSSLTRAFLAPGPKQAVMSLVERNGRVRSFHVPNVTAQTLRPLIGRHAHADSRFVTDDSTVYGPIGWNFAAHDTINHTRKEYVRGDVHTNTIEGYFSILKRGLYGVYQHVSEAHLRRYLSEFDFRYSNRIKLGINDKERANIALVGVKGKRLTYQTTRRGRPAEQAKA
ncbi:IS1595 family transposase [Methylocella tundrae]|uniref:Transposase n=1 Tax=Methylocella tundrae TaxID=227605 RepID=A0A4V6IMY3_METTU|nr:IS1595 family transposase [Methylocella tundrae]WPP03989.1 IS1595 family transposase [Methylocella tundrae]VFU10212.1 transposase [Methylocella tundrae]